LTSRHGFVPATSRRFLRQIATAAASRRRLVVDYRAGRGGGAAVRELDPLGLVLKGGVWYLVARSVEETRIYRVSRLAAVEVTELTFAPPRDFDLTSFWAHARDEFESTGLRVDVIVRLERAALPAVRRAVDWTVRPAIGEGGPVDADRVELVLGFERLDYAYADLVKLAGVVEVVAPVELRERLAAAGRSLVATYEATAGQAR
jgi:predicted DNA-binding transcriptional regulator YafY